VLPTSATTAVPLPRAATPPPPTLRELWRHRRLIGQFVRREVQSRYRGSLFGLLWSFLTPLLLLAIYTFVFGVVFRARWPEAGTGGLGDFALVVFCGLIVVNLFAECVSRAPGLVVGSPTYVKRVVFPLEILPVVSLGSALVTAGASLAVLLVVRLAAERALPWTVLLAPVVLVPVVLLTLGVAWFLASLGVFVRDISYLVVLLLQALVFITPIFYPLEAVPEGLRGVLGLNPLYPVVDDLRRVVLWGKLPDWPRLAFSGAAGAAAMVLGHAWFMKTRRAFADII
jgi:lipopolysaccharide transport system permease protein